jgi:hypothetical protein
MCFQYLRGLLVTAAIATVAFPSFAAAQVSWTDIDPPSEALRNIAWPVFPLSGNGLLLSQYDADTLYHSTDNGTSWDRYAVPGDEPSSWPSLPDIHRCHLPYITGPWKGLYRFDLLQPRFRKVEGWDSVRVLGYSVSADGDRRVLATMSDSVVLSHYLSNDAGASWTSLLPGTEGGATRIHSSYFIRDTLYFLTVPGWHCYACVPNSHEPVRLTFSVPDSLRMPYLLGDGLVITPLDSALVRSIDGGRSWKTIRSGLPDSPFDLRNCVRSPDGTIYVLLSGLDYHKRLYRSADEGRNWAPVLCAGNPRLSNFQLTAEGEIIWYRANEKFARSSGLALSTSVKSAQMPPVLSTSAFPNPGRVGTTITIETGVARSIAWQLRLMDITGMEQFAWECTADESGCVSLRIPVTTAQGHYLLSACSGPNRHLFHLRLLQ